MQRIQSAIGCVLRVVAWPVSTFFTLEESGGTVRSRVVQIVKGFGRGRVVCGSLSLKKAACVLKVSVDNFALRMVVS